MGLRRFFMLLPVAACIVAAPLLWLPTPREADDAPPPVTETIAAPWLQSEHHSPQPALTPTGNLASPGWQTFERCASAGLTGESHAVAHPSRARLVTPGRRAVRPAPPPPQLVDMPPPFHA